MKLFNKLRANRKKLLALYGENSVDYYRAVFLTSLGRSFAAMLVVVHIIVMFPGTSFLDFQTKIWLAPSIGVLVGLLFCSAWMVERGNLANARYLTNFTISASTMLSVILCGGFLESHVTPFLLAPIIVAMCISPRTEAVIVGSVTFFLPLVFDGLSYWLGWSIPNLTSVSNPTANTIFLYSTLFLTVFISLTYLQKTNEDLHATLDREQEIFRQWATVDPLTEIGNRRSFDLLMDKAHSEAIADGSQFGLIYLDLNSFKPINDKRGHEVGDVILKTVAERLVQITNNDGSVVRIGGDEFAIVLENTIDRRAADLLIDGIHQVIQAPIDVGGYHHRISASIGKAMFPDDATVISDLVRAADLDMYASKMKDKLRSVSDSQSVA